MSCLLLHGRQLVDRADKSAAAVPLRVQLGCRLCHTLLVQWPNNGISYRGMRARQSMGPEYG